MVDSDSRIEYSVIRTFEVASADISIQLFPHPATGILHIARNTIGPIDIRIVDAERRIVGRLNNASGSRIDIGVSRLPKGTCFAERVSGQSKFIRTFIKNRPFFTTKLLFMSKLTVILAAGLFFLSMSLTAQQASEKKPAPTLRSILLQQFRTTDDQAEWFVPVMKSVEGITAQQAMWKPNDSSHSIGQLAYHIWFWNKQSLDKFYGRTPDKFDGNNDETFNDFTEASWASTVQKLGQVMKDWEKAIQESDEAKLQSWYGTIAHINTHTAYHTGQILYVRKLAGNWDASKGVH